MGDGDDIHQSAGRAETRPVPFLPADALTATPTILALTSLLCLVPLVGLRLGYNDAFGITLSEVAPDPVKLFSAASMGLLVSLWIGGMILMLANPIPDAGMAQRAVGTAAALFVLGLVASSYFQTVEFFRGDVALVTYCTAFAFFVRGFLAGISWLSHVLSTQAGKYRDYRSWLILLSIPVLIPILALFVIVIPDGSATVIVASALVIALFVAVLFANLAFSVGLTQVITTVIRPDRRPAATTMTVALLLMLVLVASVSSLIAAVPDSASEEPPLSAFIALEVIVVLIVLARMGSISSLFRRYVRENGSSIVALLALLVLITGLTGMYGGAAIAERYQRGAGSDWGFFLGTQRSYVCARGATTGELLHGRPDLLLADTGSSLILWNRSDGTTRVPTSTTQLAYLESSRRSC